MDLSIPIIGIVTLLGYSFVKEGKGPRQVQNIRKNLVDNENPNGENVYHSVYTKKATNKQRELLNERFEKSKDYKNTGIVSDLINGCGIECSPIKVNPQEITVGNIYTKKEYENVASKSSVFKGADFLNKLQDTDGIGSSLTGNPMEMSHSNMQAFFRGQRKTVDPSFGGRMVENLSGITSGELYQEKRQVDNFFEPVRTSFPNTLNQDRDRYNVQTDKISNVKPNEPILVTPIPGLSMRPHYKDVNELRTNKRETIKGKLGLRKSNQFSLGTSGEMVKEPATPIIGQYWGAAKYKNRSGALGGEEYNDKSTDIPDPFETTVMPIPKNKNKFVTDFIATNLSTNRNLSERPGDISFASNKRQLNITGIEETRDITERANTKQTQYFPSARLNSKSIIRSNVEVQPTLKQGNLYSYVNSPHSKRGLFNHSQTENYIVNTNREQLSDNMDRYTTTGKGVSILSTSDNHRLIEKLGVANRMYNQKDTKIPQSQNVGEQRVPKSPIQDTDQKSRMLPILRNLYNTNPYKNQKKTF